jgi:hypothetical protein
MSLLQIDREWEDELWRASSKPARTENNRVVWALGLSLLVLIVVLAAINNVYVPTP